MLTQTLYNNIIGEAEKMQMSLEDCLSKAPNASSIQNKVDLIFKTAMSKAEKKGDVKNIIEKRNLFYNALMEGSELVRLNGKWFAVVINNIASWNHWSMKTNMYKCGIVYGADGCQYYAAYFE